MANKRQRKKAERKSTAKLTKKERLIKHYEGVSGHDTEKKAKDKWKREYQEYLTQSRRLRAPEKDILTFEVFVNVSAISKATGKTYTPRAIAIKQSWGGLTEKEADARFKVGQRLNPGKYRDFKDFVDKGGLNDVDERIAALSENNPGMSATELSALVTRTIFSPS